MESHCFLILLKSSLKSSTIIAPLIEELWSRLQIFNNYCSSNLIKIFNNYCSTEWSRQSRLGLIMVVQKVSVKPKFHASILEFLTGIIHIQKCTRYYNYGLKINTISCIAPLWKIPMQNGQEHGKLWYQNPSYNFNLQFKFSIIWFND